MDAMPWQKNRKAEDRATELRWPGTLHVRGAIWLFLMSVILVSLAVPAQSVWRAATSELQLRTCLWPAGPQVGQIARLFVVPRTADDHRAVAGPWATFVVTRRMQEMAMETDKVVREGQVTERSALALALQPEMAGTWWIRLVVRSRGHPTWQTLMPLTVLPAEASSHSGGPQAPLPSSEGCHIANGSQQL